MHPRDVDLEVMHNAQTQCRLPEVIKVLEAWRERRKWIRS